VFDLSVNHIDENDWVRGVAVFRRSKFLNNSVKQPGIHIRTKKHHLSSFPYEHFHTHTRTLVHTQHSSK